MSASVSQQLIEKYGIHIRPGGKGECPFCKHSTFSIKRDDTVGKCFHPSCGKYVLPGLKERQYENTLQLVMMSIFHDFHEHLLRPQDIAEHNPAYQYLTHERGIHPDVVADSMLGSVPPGYDCGSKFAFAIAATENAYRSLDTAKDGIQNELDLLLQSRDKFLSCTRGRDLSGQGKSGHAWSLQNRPYGMARDVVLIYPAFS